MYQISLLSVLQICFLLRCKKNHLKKLTFIFIHTLKMVNYSVANMECIGKNSDRTKKFGTFGARTAIHEYMKINQCLYILFSFTFVNCSYILYQIYLDLKVLKKITTAILANLNDFINNFCVFINTLKTKIRSRANEKYSTSFFQFFNGISIILDNTKFGSTIRNFEINLILCVL